MLPPPERITRSRSNSSSPARCSPPQQHPVKKHIKKLSDGGSGAFWKRKSPLVQRKVEPKNEGPGPPSQVTSSDPEAATSSSIEDLDAEVAMDLHNGSSDGVSDQVDGPQPRSPASQAAIEHMHAKIHETKQKLMEEQAKADENVNEYLKLSGKTEKSAHPRLKGAFEKKNQESAHNIAKLKKKLDSYQRRVFEYEKHGVMLKQKQPKVMLKDVGQGIKNVGGNIKEGITGFSGTVMSKPREIGRLIKNKFGSADNINSMQTELEESGGPEEEGGGKAHHGSATLPPSFPHSTASRFSSDEGSERGSSVTSESIPPAPHAPLSLASPRNISQGSYMSNVNVDTLKQDFQDLREDNERLKEEIEAIKKSFEGELGALQNSLSEERYRYDQLEESLNDMTELHQNEIQNLKQSLTDMEEKVQYQSEERLRDLHELIESTGTRMSKLEHNVTHQQNLVGIEGLESSTARALIVKLVNVLLTVLQVVLLLTATFAGILMPFLKTRVRVLTTGIFVLIAVVMYQQMPEIKQLFQHWVHHYQQALTKM